MTKKFTELRFEDWIETSLLERGYHGSFTHSNENEGRYDKDLCLVPEDVIGFIKETQLEEYEKLETQFESSTDSHILKTIDKTIGQMGNYRLQNHHRREEKRIELLREYRQSLISEVVTGKVMVVTHE